MTSRAHSDNAKRRGRGLYSRAFREFRRGDNGDFDRTPAASPVSTPVKVVDPATRALIDEAIEKKRRLAAQPLSILDAG